MSNNTLQPDMTWYLRVSHERGVTPRCPFRTVEGCPRFFHSLSMLGQAGSTKIHPEEEKRLDAYWQDSDLLPRTAEHDTSLSGSDGDWKIFSNFCPEVIYDRFNVFASGLGDFADSIDRDFAHERLGKIDAPAADWRWRWSWVKPLHFSECPLYSPLIHRQKLKADQAATLSQKSGAAAGEVLSLKPGIWGMSINLNEIARRGRAWWRTRSERKSP